MIQKVLVPDIGSSSDVSVIEVLVKAGDVISKDASLITLESEKASMEIPSPYAGTIKSIDLKVGDTVSEGALIATMEVEEGEGKGTEEKNKEKAKEDSKAEAKPKESIKGDVKQEAKQEAKEEAKPKEEDKPKEEAKSQAERKEKKPETAPQSATAISFPVSATSPSVHAGPAVRRFARELGVDLTKIKGTGQKGRIISNDVKTFVKQVLTSGGTSGGSQDSLGFSLSPWPKIDYAQFGEISVQPLSRIKKLSGAYLHRNWVRVPHITQFDEADITELEHFRKENQTLAEQQGVKLTPLVFIMKAVVAALKHYPQFNASLDDSGSELILKKYFHLGVAVDTPNGLVVPVVRDVDQKGLFQLAKELGELSEKARKGQLTAKEMQGSSFSISSLGGIGGTAFTPIVNVPDVAILGVSKSQMKPIFQEGEFKPRLILPLSLSYDHRVIDGAEACRFITYLVKQLSDIRRLLF